jgi:hypothetical protein
MASKKREAPPERLTQERHRFAPLPANWLWRVAETDAGNADH